MLVVAYHYGDEPSRPMYPLYHDLANVGRFRGSRVKSDSRRKIVTSFTESFVERGIDVTRVHEYNMRWGK